MIDKSIYTAISLLIIVLFSSCSLLVQGVAKAKFTEEKGAIPPDFGKEKTSLVVILTLEPYNSKIKKIVQKKYHGLHEFVPSYDLNEKKYSDTTFYRFCFEYGTGSTYYDGGATFTTKKFLIYDRVERRKYFSKFSSSWWGAMARAYLSNLEEKRLEFQTAN